MRISSRAACRLIIGSGCGTPLAPYAKYSSKISSAALLRQKELPTTIYDSTTPELHNFDRKQKEFVKQRLIYASAGNRTRV